MGLPTGLKRKTISDDGGEKKSVSSLSTGASSSNLPHGPAVKVARKSVTAVDGSASVPLTNGCAPVEGGDLFVMGNNEAGQLGLEDPSMVKRFPFLLTAERVGGHSVCKIAAGGMHSIIINTKGE